MKTFVSKHRRFLTTISALLVTVAIATVAFAQGSAPPNLAYSFDSQATPSGPTTAAPGPTEFTVSNTGSKESDFTVLRVHDGADVPKLQSDINQKLSEDQIEALPIDIAAGTSDAAKGRPASFTINLTAGTYLVANTSSETKTPSMVLTVSGNPNGATGPSPTTIVGMYDYKFKLSKHISRSGSIRVSNKGKRIHMMIALKAANAAGAAKLSSALRKGASQKVIGSLIRGGGSSLDPISPGQSVVIPVHYGKGSYVFACFWQSKASKGKAHVRLGMTKIVSVK
jgi:hypothetical protein